MHLQAGLASTPKAESIFRVSPDDGHSVSVLLERHFMIGKQFICLRLAPSLDLAKHAHMDSIAGVGIDFNGTPICLHDQLSPCAHLKLFFDFLVVFCRANDRPNAKQQAGEKAGPTKRCFHVQSFWLRVNWLRLWKMTKSE